jgi:hypothetical protein
MKKRTGGVEGRGSGSVQRQGDRLGATRSGFEALSKVLWLGNRIGAQGAFWEFGVCLSFGDLGGVTFGREVQ